MDQFSCYALAQKPEFIEEMAKAAQSEWADCHPEWGVEDRIDFYKNLLNSQRGINQALVATTAEGHFAGMAVLADCDLPHRQDLYGWLNQLYVHPQYRGLGLGTWLLAQAEAEAVGMGARALHLFTTGQKEFYEGVGWQSLEQTSLNGVPGTIMQKDLNVHMHATKKKLHLV